MPSKFIIRASIPNPAEFNAHLAAVYARALIEGVDIGTGKGSGSALVRLSVEYGAKWATSAPVKGLAALPETTSTTDAARVLAARTAAGLSLRALAALLGYANKASIQNVERKGMRLTGALKAWVETQEASV